MSSKIDMDSARCSQRAFFLPISQATTVFAGLLQSSVTDLSYNFLACKPGPVFQQAGFFAFAAYLLLFLLLNKRRVRHETRRYFSH
jgi:hypothetical protein